MKVICEICKEVIATVEMKDMAIPMVGSMFRSPDKAHGYDPPFLPDTTWEDMLCGYCNHRPFTERDGFLTENGYMKIDEAWNTYICEVCGKECKGKGAFGAHMRVHKK
jgi:hypothetical protein